MTHNTTLSKAPTRFVGLGVIAAVAFFVTVSIAYADTLNRQLDIGMSGSDVTALQTFLAADPSLYPQGLVTGYFGVLTSAAVSNFQSRNGIATVGRVGPITLAAINAQISGGLSDNAGAPIISSVAVGAGRNSATLNWNTNEVTKGVVYYSTSPLTTYENSNSLTVSGSTAMTDNSLRASQSVSIQGLQANTTYYYLVYTTDQGGNVSVTWPSTFRTTN